MMQMRRRMGGSFLAASSLVMPAVASAAPIRQCMASSSSLTAATSSFVVSCPQAVQRRFNATDASTASAPSSTALDVAMKVNKLKRMHQTGQGQGKKEVERMAWRELNTLSEQQIATAEGKAVALLLNSWAYFARFWEKGKDGPFEGSAAGGSAEEK